MPNKYVVFASTSSVQAGISFLLSQYLAQIRAGIFVRLNKPLPSPRRYGLKYVKPQPAAITCQLYKCPDVST